MLDKEGKKARKQKASKIDLRARKILQASIDGFCIVDITGKILEVNPKYCDIIGYSKEELIGKQVSDIKVDEAPEQISEHIREVTEKGYCRFETRYRCKDGRIIDVEVSSQFCDFGQDKFFFSFVRDITEHKKCERTLRESEERYKILFKGTADGILLADIETKQFKYANPAICRMLGYTKKEMEKMYVYDIHPEEDLEYVLSEFKAQAQGEKTLTTSIPCLRKDGRIIYADINTAKVTVNGKECNVGFFTDVTEHKKVLAELENYKEKIFQVQKHAYIALMGAVVAHQINQPLTRMNIYLGRAIEQIEEKSCYDSALNNVKKGLAEVKKTTLIVNKLRQYSKDPTMETGGKVNVSNIGNRIISMLSGRAKQAKMNIFARNLEELPEVEINETALEQIFLIIVQNAIEATDGRKQHKLDIVGRSFGDNIELQFSDDCCGIAPENLGKIFEPFFSTKSDGKGMGLGLGIVQQILISCSGEIRVESQIGKGSTFFVTLPICDALKP